MTEDTSICPIEVAAELPLLPHVGKLVWHEGGYAGMLTRDKDEPTKYRINYEAVQRGHGLSKTALDPDYVEQILKSGKIIIIKTTPQTVTDIFSDLPMGSMPKQEEAAAS